MGIASQDAIKQLSALVAEGRRLSSPIPSLVDCLNWRIQNHIDDILAYASKRLESTNAPISVLRTSLPPPVHCRCRCHSLPLSAVAAAAAATRRHLSPLLLLPPLSTAVIDAALRYRSMPPLSTAVIDAAPRCRSTPPLFAAAAAILGCLLSPLLLSLPLPLPRSLLPHFSGHPVFAIGVGLSTYDKASVSYYVQSHIQMNEYRDRVILVSYNLKSSLPSSNQR
ncbi:hypothetical protein GW17_00036905 [Ensete ventricosum]|nr:hypothetical protein GW17_00036905 [Ensete ventricosum]